MQWVLSNIKDNPQIIDVKWNDLQQFETKFETIEDDFQGFAKNLIIEAYCLLEALG